jgi:hypothetical protein
VLIVGLYAGLIVLTVSRFRQLNQSIRNSEFTPMNKHAQEIIGSIIEDFAVGGRSREELEAKSLFRLLNFCPPEPPLAGKESQPKRTG